MLFYLPCFFWGQSLIFVQLSSTTFCIEIYIHFSGLFLHISHNNIDMQHITIRMFIFWLLTNQFSSVAQLCPTLWDPMDCSMPGFLAHHQFPEHTQTHDHRLGDAIQPSHPLSSLLLLPSIFPSIRVFSIESVLHNRWPKYWSFSFSMSPSNEYSRTDFL